jgi:hypothetical protein
MSAAARQLVRNPFIGLPSIAPTQTVVNFLAHARCLARMVPAPTGQSAAAGLLSLARPEHVGRSQRDRTPHFTGTLR